MLTTIAPTRLALTTTALTKIALLAALAGPAAAQPFDFFLDGSQEVPPTPSAALAFASLRFDAATSEFDLFVALDGIAPGDVTGFHVHNASRGVNGGVVIDLLALAPFIADDTVPGLSTFEALDVPLASALVQELLADNLYLNIHTSAFPTGEIRGQVIPAPAAGALGLVVLGLASARRR